MKFFKNKNIKDLQGKTLIIILLAIGFSLFVYKVGDRDLRAPDEKE